MRIARSVFSIVFTCVLTLALPMSAHADATIVLGVKGTEVSNAAFGLFDTANGGAVNFVPGNVVPLVEGQGYGWIMAIQTNKKQVKWREEFTLPEAPESWGDPETLGKRRISKGAKVSNTERVVEPVNGQISNAWAVAKGDPPGLYKIRVFVEGKLARTFEFEVR